MLQLIGQLVFADRQGVLPRLGRAPAEPWASIAVQLVDDLRKLHGVNLMAIALRGSAPRQTAVIGASDLDLVIILDTSTQVLGQIQVPAMLDLKLDISIGTAHELYHASDWEWMRFALAHTGHVVWGEDIIARLPDPVLGPHAVAHLYGLPQWTTGWEDDFVAGDDREKREICQWLFKRIVRSLFESIMFDLNAYSRDIYPCAKAAADTYPAVSPAIWDAAELAIAPSIEISAITAVTAELFPLLNDLFNRRNWDQPKPR